MIRSTDTKLYFAGLLVTMSLGIAALAGHLISSTPPVIATPPPPTTQAPTTEEPIHTVNFIAVWDIMLSRNVARHAEKSWRDGWIWENISSFLHTADFVIGNLESPTNGTEKYSYQKVMNFNALPHLIEELPGVNFAAISLANNHSLDQGESGLFTTQKLLKSLGIEVVWVGNTEKNPWEPTIIEREGIKIALLGASYAACNDNGTCINKYIARMQDTKSLVSAIENARRQSDFVVVMMHAGAEYTRTPTKLQKEFAHAAIDAGADIVFGAHPHWIQNIETYQGKYIFYSLWNFVFDQEFSPETKTGLAVQMYLSKQGNQTKIKDVQLHPIAIENYWQPRIITGEEKSKVLDSIQITKT